MSQTPRTLPTSPSAGSGTSESASSDTEVLIYTKMHSLPSRYKAAAGAAALALAVGVFGPAVPSPAPASVSVTAGPVTSNAQSRVAVGHTDASPLGRLVSSETTTTGALAADVQKRPGLGPIIKWLKKNAPKYYNKLKAAAKKGRSGVEKWYYALPKPIRVTIAFLWSGTLWALFDALVRYFGG